LFIHILSTLVNIFSPSLSLITPSFTGKFRIKGVNEMYWTFDHSKTNGYHNLIASPEKWAGVVFVIDSDVVSNFTAQGFKPLREVQSGLFLYMDVAASAIKLSVSFAEAGNSFTVTSNLTPVVYSALYNANGYYFVGVESGRLVPLTGSPVFMSVFESGKS
jgi:hypothetical protein